MDTLEKSLFRLAAIVYNNSTGNMYTGSTLLSMIESVMLNAENLPLPRNTIIAALLEDYSLIITEDEFETIIETYMAHFHIETVENEKQYTLTDNQYNELEKKAKNGIDHYIDVYIQENSLETTAKDAIYQYLYNLTTTNIASYKRFLGLDSGNGISSDELISVDPSLFTDSEKNHFRFFVMG